MPPGRLSLSNPLTAEPRASCNRSPKPKTNRNDNGRWYFGSQDQPWNPQLYRINVFRFEYLGHGIGSEQEGYRPVVIIQNDVGNKHSPTVIIASITSKKDAKPKLPTHYYIDAENGLELPSIVLLEQLRTVDKRRLGNFIGHLSEKHIHGINHALAVSIGLIESVPKKLILCLCSACADNFYGTGAYSLRRIDPQQTEKDTCTYCNQRKGYDYEIIPKNR